MIDGLKAYDPCAAQAAPGSESEKIEGAANAAPCVRQDHGQKDCRGLGRLCRTAIGLDLDRGMRKAGFGAAACRRLARRGSGPGSPFRPRGSGAWPSFPGTDGACRARRAWRGAGSQRAAAIDPRRRARRPRGRPLTPGVALARTARRGAPRWACQGGNGDRRLLLSQRPAAGRRAGQACAAAAGVRPAAQEGGRTWPGCRRACGAAAAGRRSGGILPCRRAALRRPHRDVLGNAGNPAPPAWSRIRRAALRQRMRGAAARPARPSHAHPALGPLYVPHPPRHMGVGALDQMPAVGRARGALAQRDAALHARACAMRSGAA